MKKLAMALEGLTWPIKRISRHRMTDISHMDTNLVRATCFQLQLYQGIVAKTFKNGKSCNCRFSFSCNCLLFAVLVRTPNRSLNHASIVRQIAMHDSHIFAKRLLILKLSRQSIVSLIILSDHKETRRVLVDTVDNPWTNHTIDRREVLDMIHQSIDQGTRSMTS